jgi:hypothetical protein
VLKKTKGGMEFGNRFIQCRKSVRKIIGENHAGDLENNLLRQKATEFK